LKLPSRPAASKALSALRGGSSRFIRISSFDVSGQFIWFVSVLQDRYFADLNDLSASA
jgi:hypothetical protein